MQKWSVNPKSDMQTLKAHEALFKKGYWTKGGIYYYYCWFGAFEQQHSVQPRQLGLKTTSPANEGSAVQLSALVSFKIDHPGLSTAFIVYINVQDPVHSEGLFAGSRFAAGDLAGNPKAFIGSLIPSLSFACQLLLHQQGHSIALRDSQFSFCSFRAAISRSKRLGAWAPNW